MCDWVRTAYDDSCKEKTLVPHDYVVPMGEPAKGGCFLKVLPCKKCGKHIFWELINGSRQFVFDRQCAVQTAIIFAKRTSPMQNLKPITWIYPTDFSRVSKCIGMLTALAISFRTWLKLVRNVPYHSMSRSEQQQKHIAALRTVSIFPSSFGNQRKRRWY